MNIYYSVKPSLVAKKFQKKLLANDFFQEIYTDKLDQILYDPDKGIFLRVNDQYLKESMALLVKKLEEHNLPISFEGQNLLSTFLPTSSDLIEAGFVNSNSNWEWQGGFKKPSSKN